MSNEQKLVDLSDAEDFLESFGVDLDEYHSAPKELVQLIETKSNAAVHEFAEKVKGINLKYVSMTPAEGNLIISKYVDHLLDSIPGEITKEESQ